MALHKVTKSKVTKPYYYVGVDVRLHEYLIVRTFCIISKNGSCNGQVMQLVFLLVGNSAYYDPKG